MIPPDWLDDLKRRTDLAALGTRYGVQWQTRGRELRACCPFHDERTPSFHLLADPRSGPPRYVCYGACGRSWSAVSFLVDGHQRDFLDAVEELAQAAGLTVPRKGETAAAAAARAAAKGRREAILAAIELAQAYFARALQADRPEAAAARAYVEGRGLAAAVEPWGLGYAPPGDGLVQWLDRHGVDPEVAHQAYLVRRGESGGRYAFLRDRLTLRWRDRAGRTVAHVGRALQPDAEPKYLNPGEIPGLYIKGELLFGLHEAAAAIARHGVAWVVEGQLSCLTPHLHGHPQVVACGGKAFTPAHARLLLGAGARRAVFVLDGDDAGRQGAEAAVPVAEAEGLPTEVAALPQGLDPDDYLRQPEAA